MLRRLFTLSALFVAVLLIAPLSAAFAAYSSTTQVERTSTTAKEAIELSGLVASPTYANWYWAHSDVWKTTDVFAACTQLSAGLLSECQQVQRARLWAFKLDPNTHAVLASRSFAISDPQWALDPNVAQNNDWEDITLSPTPTASGATALLIGAVGDAKNNPVRDASGQNITCNTRRLIELPEPDLTDPVATTWTPTAIYDLKNYVGLGGLSTCDAESLVATRDPNGDPKAYVISRAGGRVLSRSLDPSTGRSPLLPRASAGSGLPYEPSINFVGTVMNSQKSLFTAADTNGSDIAMVSPANSTKPCQVFHWTTSQASLGTTITSTAPAKYSITCRATEGLAFARNSTDPTSFTRNLYAISDNKTRLRYWFIPWQ